MKNITAVIGANYGDEGKGLLTDYVSSPNSVVIRFNGGAQAGHTVVTPEGVLHVFQHFGAGTFRGARTLLSRFFLVDPIQFRKEHAELTIKMNDLPSVSRDVLRLMIDEDAPVVTPYDRYLNQSIELIRQSNGKQHGSCGYGINEAVTRTLAGFEIAAGDLKNPADVRRKLQHIRNDYLPIRAEQLGFKPKGAIFSDFLIERFLDDCSYLALLTDLVQDEKFVRSCNKDLVFEGAQGLALDELSSEFPHVTRSRTGLTNIKILLQDAGLDDICVRVIYATRAYLTRHGAGRLKNELTEHPYNWKGYETNRPNLYQGSFRYAPLDVPALTERIDRDVRSSELENLAVSLCVTCLDQVPEEEAIKIPFRLMPVGFPVTHFSEGTSRTWIKTVDTKPRVVTRPTFR